MPRDAGCLTDAEMGFDNSARTEAKRGHQWYMDATTPELFSNKKQAVDAVNSRTILEIPHMYVSPWHNTSSFQSVTGKFPERLFGSEPVQTVNLVDMNIPSVNGGSSNMGRKDFQDHYNNSSRGLSMSHFVEDPSGFSVGGIRKVRVNQVRDYGNGSSAPIGHSYSRGDDCRISMGSTYHKIDSSTISLGPINNNSDENTISMGHTLNKVDTIFDSLNKGDENFISMGYNYPKRNESMLSTGQTFDKGDSNFLSSSQPSEKGGSHVISMDSSYNKEHGNFISMGHNHDNTNENFISINSSYSEGTDNIMAIATTYDKPDSNITSVDSTQNKGDSGVLSMDHNYNKGETHPLCFRVFQDETEANPSGNIISGYDLLMSTQSSAPASEELGQNDLVESNVNSVGNSSSNSNTKTDILPKNKEPKTAKKVPVNSFPSNVKSLLSTGMFDGVPVKYVSWTREKSLKGTIKGTGYLCGCKDCNFSKAVNAYEFERHTNCKSKHPNNHIYFENGKTIYAVVQELKSTPQEKLFEVIQTVTGSIINQKNFLIWKASYQAATRELQRIYGKDDIAISS
ncbi:uncharacterized protein LOC123227935 isoform X2 [Mangifera indica]|nr:uncharacterized protein LOC123227935 isoform X2 [Mangifera indica]XP_044509023.1 uncharacterized protein LOC123227935 isoform X2 [Mangifera indica]XP_044509024.1 uncharacterized protein LOC123227935 isoform X2 [Mangifera indica]